MLSTEQIITTMSSQGLRITDQRKTLARLFAESPGYLTPKDVYEYMGKTYSGLSFDTV
jgi:Fur family zinc uptake transcriptional regulator